MVLLRNRELHRRVVGTDGTERVQTNLPQCIEKRNLVQQWGGLNLQPGHYFLPCTAVSGMICLC